MSRICCLRLHRSGLSLTLVGIFSLVLVGCGGSGSNSVPPPGDFSISASPTDLALGIGGNQAVIVSATPINGFDTSISVSVSGLPTGVTANPSSFSLSPGNSQEITLTAAGSAQPVTATVTFQGSSGGLSHSAKMSLAIVAPVTGAHPPTRTQYLRTNAFYNRNELQYAPPHFSVYDAAHKRFFISNPFMNEIDVFDASQEIETAQIPVPLVWGLDISPYNGSLYAATLIGDVYQIDTATLGVTTRYPAASIGPQGFSASTALVLSDGRLALQGGIGEVAVLGVDGNGVSVVWNPVTNSLDTGAHGSVCDVGNEGAFALSGDRTRILVTTVDEGGGGEPVCSYDPSAKNATYGTFPYATFVRQIIPSPDGTRFFLTSNLNGVGVFDAKTVQLLGQITGPYPGLPNAPSGAVMSLDGTTLYLVDQSSGAIGGFDTTALSQKGWVPSFTTDDYLGSGIMIASIDETGLIIGPAGHGVGFVDASQMTPAQPTLIASAYATPPTGSLSGDTTLTSFAYGTVSDSAVLSQIYVGNVPGAFATYASSAQVTTPPSNQSGAVDLTTVLSDGGVGLAPEAFSYGPAILEVIPNGATAEGGQIGAIIGYGFGNSTSGVQVTVGGQSAQVTAVYDIAPIRPYPFPVNALQFIIPPGVAGSAVDVSVSTSSGSTTATGAFHYTAAVQSYSIAANLQSGIYDAARDLYYFADKAQIQVLSKTAGKWLSPIPLPGVSSKTQLLAISESPDGSKLAVSDYGGQSIYVLDPDNPASATMYPMSLDHDGFAASIAPTGLAITNTGIVYFDTADINGTGTPLFHKLNTGAGTITDLGGSQAAGNDYFDRVLLSPDGSKIYSCLLGNVAAGLLLDTSNDNITFHTAYLTEDFPDLAISADGSTVDTAGQLNDSVLDPENLLVFIDWETWFPLAANGQKLNHDGSIVFSPLTDGIDILARNTGRLLYRIQIPVTPANVYDVLVVAEGQNALAVISANAVSFVDLSDLPISGDYARPFVNGNHFREHGSAQRPAVKVTRCGLLNCGTHGPRLKRRLGQSQGHAASQ